MMTLSERLSNPDWPYPALDLDVRFQLLHLDFDRDEYIAYSATNLLERYAAATAFFEAWDLTGLDGKLRTEFERFRAGFSSMRLAIERVADPTAKPGFLTSERSDFIRDLLDDKAVRLLSDRREFSKQIDGYMMGLVDKRRDRVTEAFENLEKGLEENAYGRGGYYQRALSILEPLVDPNDLEPDPVLSLYIGWLRWQLGDSIEEVNNALFTAALHSATARGTLHLLCLRLQSHLNYLNGRYESALNGLQKVLDLRHDIDALADATIISGFAGRHDDVGRLFEYFGRVDPTILVVLLSEWSYRRGEEEDY